MEWSRNGTKQAEIMQKIFPHFFVSRSYLYNTENTEKINRNICLYYTLAQYFCQVNLNLIKKIFLNEKVHAIISVKELIA